MGFFFLFCQENLEKFICQSYLDVFWFLLCNLGQKVVCLLWLATVKQESSSVGELCFIDAVEVPQIPQWRIWGG